VHNLTLNLCVSHLLGSIPPKNTVSRCHIVLSSTPTLWLSLSGHFCLILPFAHLYVYSNNRSFSSPFSHIFYRTKAIFVWSNLGISLMSSYLNTRLSQLSPFGKSFDFRFLCRPFELPYLFKMYLWSLQIFSIRSRS
jgi:hypothetical protein